MSEEHFVKPCGSLTEFEGLIHSGKWVVVDFWATWCPPCVMAAPLFENLAKQYSSDNLTFIKVDRDQVYEVYQKYNVRAMPTFRIYKDGQSKHEVVGLDPEALLIMISKTVEESKVAAAASTEAPAAAPAAEAAAVAEETKTE